MKTELTPEEINKAAVSSEFKKAYWKIRVDAFESGARWAQSLLTKQEEQFKPCGEGENICNCKSESECGYLEQPQANDADAKIKEYLGELHIPFNEQVEVYYPAIVGMVDELQSEIQSLKQANAELSKKIPKHHFMDSEGNLYKDQDPFGVDMSGIIRIRQVSKHDKQ